MRLHSLPPLPPVSDVDVVRLKEVDADHVGDTMRAAVDAPRVRLDDEPARHIASLWRALPTDEQARCHILAFGLRFLAGGQLL
jgi:hypothetical protein